MILQAYQTLLTPTLRRFKLQTLKAAINFAWFKYFAVHLIRPSAFIGFWRDKSAQLNSIHFNI